MFLWQVPHFLAISIFRSTTTRARAWWCSPTRSGGERAARINAVRYTVALWPISLLFVPLGTAGSIYFWTALVAGLLFVAAALAGLREKAGRQAGRAASSRCRSSI